ncbi:PAS domain S-box-containing protein [Rhizobium subbaraonis]|uniref:histidine kinase n=1 Tax=Rhizobium subbaraonis TaxID=908946 RepID=A0A285UKW1_9HYPH|nr:PAS domain S-box protein [Rhizobium subbaraonis]SOC42520.1 PAS domain S-box-containing protein [Rhizobium subbaraonis]
MQSPQDFSESLYESMPFPVILTDAAGTGFFLNDAARRALGWKGDGSEPLAAVLGQADLVPRLQGYAVAGRAHSHTLRFNRADESDFEASAHVISIRSTDGEAGYALLLRSLLTGGSHGEQVLLGSRIYSALDTIPEGVAIFDRDEKILVFNRAFRDGCGAAKDAVRVGATVESIIRANVGAGIYRGIVPGTPEAEAMIQSRLRDHRGEDGQVHTVQRADGRWIRSESHVMDSGEVVGLRIDITDLKAIEHELETRNRQHTKLLELLPDLIVRTDKDMVIRFCNEHYATFYGSTPEKLVGTHVMDLVSTEQPVIDELERLTPDNPLATVELAIRNAAGEERWLLWTATASFENGLPTEFVGAGRDVTELKRQHERLTEQARELQRKNEALNQFAATVSHDLKSPIRHIASFAEMILDDIERGQLDDLATHAAYMRRAAFRMQKLVDRLLEYAQIAYQIRHVKSVSLDAVVADALSLLEGHIREAGATIEAKALPPVRGDPELLRRLMQNLIGNAIKYRRRDSKPTVRIYGEGTADSVRIVVEDDGIGIDPKHAEAVFGLFQRLHQDERVYDGTGIGLALAQRIVESHSGTVALDTSYRDGARFIVVLPRG